MVAQEYTKHLIECKCILPQFKRIEPPKWHCFVVFSEIDEAGAIIPSFAQCNNCGIIHKVTEVGTSSILERDDLPSLSNLEDIKAGLPEKLVEILEKYQCELPTYQEVAFILEHKQWGRMVILTKEVVEHTIIGKYLLIIGETLWKISTFQEEMVEE
jgi:hypothetical protein